MIALFGVSTITHLLDGLFSLIFICCAYAYLYYLAFNLWRSKADLLISSNIKNLPSHSKLVFSDYFNGLILTLSNPKTITVYLALVPSIFGSNFSILLLVGGIYIFAAINMKRFLGKRKNQQRLLKTRALLLALLASAMLLSEILHRI